MRRVVAWVMIVVGGLWVFLTGSCTGYFAYQGYRGMDPANITTAPLAESVLGLSLIIGAVCIAPGLIVLIAGLVLRPRGAGPAA